MPPTLPRKRLRADSPSQDTKKPKVTKPDESPTPSSSRRKATLYDDLDATSTSNSKNSKAFLEILDATGDESSLSSLSDADFEDVPLAKRQKTAASAGSDGDGDEDDSDEDMEFEDVEAPRKSMIEAPAPSGDLELTLHQDTRMSLTNMFGDKKGPSKLERRVRIATHCMHVQSLLWHNAIRNAWISDPEVQAIMMSHVPPRLFDEVDRWRRASGLEVKPKETQPSPRPPKKGAKGVGKQKNTRARGKAAAKDGQELGSRDWSAAADRLEDGVVDMSHGDPLFRLLKSLSSWWKQRFKVTAPGVRKQGYMSLERIDRLTKAWATTEEDNPVLFGERIRGREGFRLCATNCAGSRDTGTQLFTALLRALGLEARMVASLQPLGFGWTKAEEADPEKDTSTLAEVQRQRAEANAAKDSTTGSSSRAGSKVGTPRKPNPTKTARSKKVADSDREELNPEHPDSDEESVVEIDMTPSKPNARAFDKDLDFPHYWTEILSPVTQTWLPVDAIVKAVVATNRELVESLEPRGGKADRAKQVMAYIVGYSADGTAKDVTVRYLKRQMLPGRTKGMRMPAEKVPVYNRHGKVKRYELYEWFKRALSGFTRGTREHPVTEIDELEDTTDLKPVQPEKKEVKEGEETLQYYKQSKDFVLERHLKREEALLPGSQPVKTFNNKSKGKGKGKKKDDAAADEGAAAGEPVYLRKDIVQVKSAETWHKQGRAPVSGEQPLKRVPYRAATTNKRREIAAAEALTGEKALQGLYSFDQTDWIIPPPIENGVIPKNEYGNIDLFAEHMCPEGAVHVPFRGAVKVCKRLQVDYAEAVVGFEFGHRMAVPVIQGIVCAEEYHDQVMEELRKDEEERARKEDDKRRKASLRLWSKFIKGLRIVERIKQDYGHIRDDLPVFGHGAGHIQETSNEAAAAAAAEQEHHEGRDFDDMRRAEEDMGGGFLPDGYDEEEPEPQPETKKRTSSFFPVLDEEDEDGPDDLVVDHGETARPMSVSEQAEQAGDYASEGEIEPLGPAKRNTRPRTKAKATRTGTRGSKRHRKSDMEDEEEEEGDEEDEDDDEDEYMDSDGNYV